MRINRPSNPYLKIESKFADMSLEQSLNESDLLFSTALVQNEYNFAGVNTKSDSYSVIRTDTHKELGYGKSSIYNPVTYNKTFSPADEVMRSLNYKIANVVNYDGGTRASILYYTDTGQKNVKGHPIQNRIYLTSGFDGTAISLDSFAFELVCLNGAGIWRKDGRHSMKHTRNVDVTRLPYGIAKLEEAFNRFIETMSTWSQKTIDSNEVKLFLDHLLPAQEREPGKRQNARRDNARTSLANEIDRQAELRNESDYTVASLFQGVTGYLTYNTSKRDSANQFEYLLTHDMQDQAHKYLAERFGE